MFDGEKPFGDAKKALKVDFFEAKEERQKQKNEQQMDQIAQLIFNVSKEFGGLLEPKFYDQRQQGYGRGGFGYRGRGRGRYQDGGRGGY